MRGITNADFSRGGQQLCPLTIGSGASTSESQNCVFYIENGFCIVNFAAITCTGNAIVATNLPMSKIRGNVTNREGIILYNDNNNIMATGSITEPFYGQLIYPIAD